MLILCPVEPSEACIFPTAALTSSSRIRARAGLVDPRRLITVMCSLLVDAAAIEQAWPQVGERAASASAARQSPREPGEPAVHLTPGKRHDGIQSVEVTVSKDGERKTWLQEAGDQVLHDGGETAGTWLQEAGDWQRASVLARCPASDRLPHESDRRQRLHDESCR